MFEELIEKLNLAIGHINAGEAMGLTIDAGFTIGALEIDGIRPAQGKPGTYSMVMYYKPEVVEDGAELE